jgi:etoposide-induced 2.4 mRNA
VSWLYALYSFDYKWGLSSKGLQERIAFFQQHWAFFLGRACA